MYFYSASPLSQSYILRGSNRPVLVPTIPDDESSSALTFGELDHSALPLTFLPLLDADREGSEPSDSERPATKKRRLVHPEPTRRPVLSAGGVTTLDSLSKLFSGARPHPHSPLQQSGSPPLRSAASQLSEKHDTAADALNAVLEFFHGLAAHANDAANGSVAIPETSLVPQVQAGPAVDKGKGKAKAERTEPLARPTLIHTLLGVPTPWPSDQELKDIELAVKLSLEDRNAADAKKASISKAIRSSAGATTSRVKLDGDEGVPLSKTFSSASDSTSATSKHVPSPASQPVSPLTAFHTIRNNLSTLEPTSKFAASQLHVTKDVEANRCYVEPEELEAPAAQEVAPVDATLVVEGAEFTGLGPSTAVSQDDADVDLAISEEYLPSPLVDLSKSTFAELCKNAASQTAEGSSSPMETTPDLGTRSQR